MATIEERGIKYQGDLASSFLGMPDLLEGAYNGYIKGATEQKNIDIEKACEWLEMNLHKDLSIGTWEDDEQSIIADFRKAMEE